VTAVQWGHDGGNHQLQHSAQQLTLMLLNAITVFQNHIKQMPAGPRPGATRLVHSTWWRLSILLLHTCLLWLQRSLVAYDNSPFACPLYCRARRCVMWHAATTAGRWLR
jgi:hypothetical protein